MPVDDPNTIDIMSDDRDGRVVLTISDHLDWSDTASHLNALQRKLNRYLAFAESGEILEHRSQASAKGVAIQVVFRFAPTLEGKDFLERTRAIVQGAGFIFTYRVFPMFDVPPDAPTIPASRVQEILDEEGIF